MGAATNSQVAEGRCSNPRIARTFTKTRFKLCIRILSVCAHVRLSSFENRLPYCENENFCDPFTRIIVT